MIKDRNISQVTETISMQMREDEENFIYQRIRPFCEEIVERKINKKEFEKILITGINALKQQSCEDAISRQEALYLVADYDLSMGQVVKGIHALPPVTPQPKTGRWVMKHRTHNETKLYTGQDDMGETHTISVLERYEVDEPYCSECGKLAGDTSQNYCCACGAKMGFESEVDT